MVTEIAIKRIEIFNFYKKYSLAPNLEAFKIPKEHYTIETLIKNNKCHMYVGWTGY